MAGSQSPDARTTLTASAFRKGVAAYFKAEKVIRSINERMDWRTKIRSSMENIVLWIALGLFGATQLVFAGTHIFNRSHVYELNRAAVRNYLSAHLASAEAVAAAG